MMIYAEIYAAAYLKKTSPYMSGKIANNTIQVNIGGNKRSTMWRHLSTIIIIGHYRLFIVL